MTPCDGPADRLRHQRSALGLRVAWDPLRDTTPNHGRPVLPSDLPTPPQRVERVLSYSKFHNPEDEVAGFLLAITERAEIVFAPSPLSPVTRDAADDRALECAVTGRADFIVSGDLHLKELKSFQEIPILSPAEFLQRFPS